MSQRRLAELSGVDHSTISRLTRSGRGPTLGTAAKLARALGAPSPGGYAAWDAARGADRPVHHLALVERALRSDDLMGEDDVRQVMRLYLGLRARGGSARRVGAGYGAPSPNAWGSRASVDLPPMS